MITKQRTHIREMIAGGYFVGWDKGSTKLCMGGVGFAEVCDIQIHYVIQDNYTVGFIYK